MSDALGHNLAALQVDLAHGWQEHGPGHVEQRVRALTLDELVGLVMVNIGTTVEHGN